ncbi:arrestin domain-containing protein 3 isoform X3 [Astyanax mexicanus]|uniref:arrestin domain-containing protein 3 isoform X3 n=1 Tax=Astyanax mexicanus TaxID=7994 RepID=UPI0020CAD5E6|nr:arrestin domain-containing protein 3 isoform X3 [Astyanax mexicanus]
MSGTIKEFTLNYDPVNQQNTFTSGDVLQGRVLLEVSKEVTINQLYIKCKGDADVWWTERSGDKDESYSSHERYFKIKQTFIQDPSKPVQNEPNTTVITGEIYGNVVRPGRRHVFPFSFQLPHGNLPPSFKGIDGNIKYTLEVTLDRSWKRNRTIKEEFTFVPRIAVCDSLMIPQSDAKVKNINFNSGSASLSATVERIGYVQGDTIKVSTNIIKSSSRKMRLKYKLEQRHTYFAQGNRSCSAKTILKLVGDSIPAESKQTVNTMLRIPEDVELSIECGIIKVEYFLKVYLDIPFSRDPEIKFPITILPAGQLPYPGPSKSDFPPYAPNPSPQPAFRPSPLPQPALGPSPPGAAAGPPPGLYPSLNPSPAYPQPTNPEEPPPSYTDVYGEESPPPYPALDFLGPFPSAPQQLLSESASGQAGEARRFWSSNFANSGNQAESQPVEIPDNIHHQTGF